MRTGISPTSSVQIDNELMCRVLSILKVLTEASVHTAVEFTKPCGRQNITAMDTILALKYQAVDFFKHDHSVKLKDALREEREHSDDSDDEYQFGIGTYLNEEEEEFSLVCTVPAKKALHQEVLQVATQWASWHPTDPLQKLLKLAIDQVDDKHN